jgi:hypothetical protein
VNVVELLIGLGLLTLGRRLFWVFVGGAGFVAGLWAMQTFFPEQPEHMTYLAGAVGAAAGIALVKFVKTIAVTLGGFLGGGLIGLGLARMLGPWVPEWLAFVLVGIAGVLAMKRAFDTALLLISSIAGAMLVANSLPVAEPVRSILLVGLAIGGVLIQRTSKKSDSRDNE